MRIVYLVKNNIENYKVQKMYFKRGIEWEDIGKNFRSLTIGSFGTLVGQSCLNNNLGYCVLNTIREFEFAKTKVFIKNFSQKNKLEI